MVTKHELMTFFGKKKKKEFFFFCAKSLTITQDVKERKQSFSSNENIEEESLNIWWNKSLLDSPASESVLNRKASQRETPKVTVS